MLITPLCHFPFFKKESAKRAEEVFDGILKCKGRADATRNALNILQSHRVLFNLPRSIERNIKAVRTVLFLMVVHSLNLPLSLSLC